MAGSAACPGDLSEVLFSVGGATRVNIHPVTGHGSSYCLWLINQERVLWAPEDTCLLSWGTLNSFYILLFLRAIAILLSLVRRLKDYFWGPVIGGSWQSTRAWCPLTLTPLARSFSSMAELAVPGLYGWSSGTRKSTCEQTACVNGLCEWKYHWKTFDNANSRHLAAWPSFSLSGAKTSYPHPQVFWPVPHSWGGTKLCSAHLFFLVNCTISVNKIKTTSFCIKSWLRQKCRMASFY